MKLRQKLGRFGSRSWTGWPAEAYAQPRYQQRLQAVQMQLIDCLDEAPAGPLRLVSMCAGDGRDVIGVLPTHSRRSDLSAWLVELDGDSVDAGIREAAIAGLQNAISFVHGDATDYATYAGIAPADVVLACGVWGHVPASERSSVTGALACLCKPHGAVIWTRGVSDGIARLREIEVLFSRPPWESVRTTITADKKWAVATNRYGGPAIELPRSGRIFNFQRRAGRR